MYKRQVEQIIRDLVEASIHLVRDIKRKEMRPKAEKAAEDRVLDALVGAGASEATKDSFRKKLRAGELDEKEVEIEFDAPPAAPNKMCIRDRSLESKTFRYCPCENNSKAPFMFHE